MLYLLCLNIYSPQVIRNGAVTNNVMDITSFLHVFAVYSYTIDLNVFDVLALIVNLLQSFPKCVHIS